MEPSEKSHEALDEASNKEVQPSVSSRSSRGKTPEHDGGQIQPTQTNASEIVYPSTAKTAVIMLCLYISMFLVALDRTILATAVPRITDSFHSIDDIGWYASSYMLTACGFILVYGRVYTFYNTKWVFLSGIILFEVGSAISGAAPNSTALIIGRAIAGFGSSGIFTGAITIMINTVPLHKRPMYQGLFGATFAIASVVGPLLGGAFTDSKATWRWCFYINLPLGGIVVTFLTFFLHLNEKEKKKVTLKEQFMKLDPLGTLFFLPSIVCLLLALQWGGTKYDWSSWRVILLLVIFAAGFVAFVIVQAITRNTTATIPSRIILQRSVIFSAIYTFFNGSVFMTEVYYIPIWFQAIKGSSAVHSGIQSIPLVLSLVTLAMLCGILVQRFGYYTPFMWCGSVIMTVGTGMIHTWKVDSGHNEWIGYQVLLGIGIGMGMQQSNLAVQTVLQHRDVPTGSALIFFCQTLGGAVFVSVGQNVFLKKFAGQLRQLPAGVLNMQTLLNTGATEIRNVVPPQYRDQVIRSYNYALMNGPMLVCIILACITFVGALGVEVRSTKEQLKKKQAAAQQQQNEKQDIEKEAES
ncbi:uncharacterized protein PV09_02079 [Verruconis gallopava]|uniref:Major facilitator superfamily (MFS) profile domain-containing protein n=1 Tax=Verruconis gallopava TaxID=253628 RepID=A0A0D2AL09_9PEZI|nr:uncharacterized protein PV09_02079 [Verruconis gallopava]KIW07220.1 hypothetical protein PV09_02079 [Verruconis gallopava]